MNTFKLTKEETLKLAQMHTTPLLVVSSKQIEVNYETLGEHLPHVQIFYAMKANPADSILQTLDELGSCFDVASDGEMMQLNRLGIHADRMVYANPFKTPRGLAVAKKLGVNKFTYDSASEADKIAETIPNGTVLLRVRIDNSQALVDLNKKFGAVAEDALELLRYAKQKDLDVGGLCFHVGSQSTSADAYLQALQVCRRLFDEAAASGMPLRILDIGGGFPIPTPSTPFDLGTMLDEINTTLTNLFPTTQIWAEPGRFICGTAVNLITSVIGTQYRNHQPWYFLDEGLYGTFSGILFDHWKYELEPLKQGIAQPSVFAGPSCDSLDILFRDHPTPPLNRGDLILVPNCGAYSSASASEFNGFAKTPQLTWEDVKHQLHAKPAQQQHSIRSNTGTTQAV